MPEYHVVEAATADEALAFLEKYSSLQLLFTDVQTGGDPDGFELAREDRRAVAEHRGRRRSGAESAEGGQAPGQCELHTEAVFRRDRS